MRNTFMRFAKKQKKKSAGEEIFFADVQANLSSNAMQEALSKVREHTSSLKILGCYEADERHG